MTRSTIARLVTAGSMLLALTACSGESAPEPPRATETRATEGPDARADLTVVPQDQLPEGWRSVPAEDRLDGSPGTATYCGVVAEPDDVEEGRIAYYEETSLPRSMLEYGMLTTEESATRTLDALLARRTSCEEPERVVEPVPPQEIDGIGDQQVAWDFASEDRSVRYRVLVFRRADVVVALVATGQTSVPQSEQLDVARSIDARLQAS